MFKKMNVKMLFALMAIGVLALSGASQAGSAQEWSQGVQQSVAPDFYLNFSPALPTVDTEVVVTLVSDKGLPPNASLRWHVSGSPFTNAHIKDPQTGSYAFTPVAPGSFIITAELTNPQGGLVSISTLELVVVPEPSAQPAGIPAPAGEVTLDISPSVPRVGRDATFTFQSASGIPEGAEVRWEVSGGPFANLRIHGRNKESCTIVPNGQNAYLVRAALHGPQGHLMAEISLHFIPMP